MRVSRRNWAGAAIWLCAAAPASAQMDWLWGPPLTLEAMARRLESAFPDVRHLPAETLAEDLSARSQIQLFDVREPAEFEVSHLSGAELLAPDTTETAVINQLGARAAGRTVVFYCSVGQRSSRMARRTQQALTTRGASAVFSLRGGIFAWRNQDRQLVDRWGSTPYVHPYSTAWARLLTHPEFARLNPRARA